MLLSGLLDFPEMFVITILGQPADNITVRPIDLQCVAMLIVDMVLKNKCISNEQIYKHWITYVDWHLVNMYTFFNTKLGNENVESSIKHADNNGWSYDRTITLRKIRHKYTEIQMR